MKKRLLSAVAALCLAWSLFAGLSPAVQAADDTIKGYLVPYTVKAGDTIYGICQAKGLNFDANLARIGRINGLTNYNYMVPGKILWLPSDTAPTGSGYYTLLGHTLVYGETPAVLCQSYGIDYSKSYNMLSALNDNLGTFMAGQNFVLPLYSNASAAAKPDANATATGPDTTTGESVSGYDYAAGGSGAGSAGEGYAAGGPGAGSGLNETTSAATGTAAGGTTAATGAAGTVTGGTTSTTAAAAPAVPKGGTVRYYLAQRVLKAGETVSGICAELGVNFDENEAAIRTLNNITNYNNMGVGQVLLIPSKTVPSGSYYRIVEHTIAAGDTTLALCESYGLNYATYAGMIQQLNPNTNLNMIYVGQKLLMPQYIANGSTAAAVTPAGTANIAAGAAAGTAATTTTAAPTTAPASAGYGYAAGGSGAGSTGSGYAAGGAGAGTGYTEANGGGTLPTPTPTAAPTAAANTANTAANTAAAAKIPKADTLDYYLVAHVLQGGETVSGICADLGVDFDANAERIRTLSNVTNFNYLMPGKTILIPTTAAPKSGPYYKIMKHTFVTGDTVYDLCAAYGLDYTNNVTFLQRLNNRDNMASFYVGQSIYMPVYVAG